MTLLEAARRDIEKEFRRVLGESAPECVVEYALSDLVGTSDISSGRYSPDDVVLSVRRTLVKATEALESTLRSS